jgi:hypothetical protein
MDMPQPLIHSSVLCSGKARRAFGGEPSVFANLFLCFSTVISGSDRGYKVLFHSVVIPIPDLPHLFWLALRRTVPYSVDISPSTE